MTEALEREVHEETGIRVLDPGGVAFVAQMDDRLHGWFATVFTWEVARWEGRIAPADSDGFVRDAAFIPVADAVEHLEGLSWHSITVRHLLGELPPASVWLRRVHRDGAVETAGPF